MQSKLTFLILVLSLVFTLSGCVAVAVVGVATSVVGGAIDVVDVVTPDIMDDDDDDDDDDNE